MKTQAEYAMYKGDDLLAIGTIEELAKVRGIKKESMAWYMRPSGRKRQEKLKNGLKFVDLDGDEE